MKKYFYSFLPMLMAVMSMTFTSCSKDDSEDDEYNIESSTENERESSSKGLSTGWYYDGDLEQVADQLMRGYVSAGDDYGAKTQDWDAALDFVTAIHVTSANSFEAVVGGASTSKPKDYFSSKSYSINGKSITLYFYFSYDMDTYSVVSGKAYSKRGNESGKISSSGSTITWSGHKYSKMNYSPKNW